MSRLLQSNLGEMFKSLGISNRIQQEAVRLLECSRYHFMESANFRYKLVESLAPVKIKKINVAIDALVEQKLLIRRLDGNRHEIGLKKEIWKLSSETISVVREYTVSEAESMLIESEFCNTVYDVKVRIRKMRVNRRDVSDIALDILAKRFLVREFPDRWHLNADKEMVVTSSATTHIKEPINRVAPPKAEAQQPLATANIQESTSSQEPSMNLEDWAYEQVGEELDSNKPDKGIWTKAFAQANGDDKQTKVLYIKMRVEKLIQSRKPVKALAG